MPVLVNDVKTINKLVTTAITSSTKFAELLHDAAYNCVMHDYNTGDIRPLQRLYNGLSPNAKLALRVWAVKFLQVRFKNETFAHNKKPVVDLGSAFAIGPMEYQKPKAVKTAKVFDLKKELEAVLARAIKHSVTGPTLTHIEKAIKAA